MTPSAPLKPQTALQQQCGELSPKEAQFSPQFHSAPHSRKGSSDCTELAGSPVASWRREAQSDLLPQHETNYCWLRSSLGRNRATGSPRKLQQRAMHQASSGLSCCLTQYRAGKLLSRNKCLAEAAETPPDWLGKLLGKLSHWDPNVWSISVMGQLGAWNKIIIIFLMRWTSQPEPQQGSQNRFVSAGHSNDPLDNQYCSKGQDRCPSGSIGSRQIFPTSPPPSGVSRGQTIPGFLITRTTVLLRFGRICRIGLRVVHRWRGRGGGRWRWWTQCWVFTVTLFAFCGHDSIATGWTICSWKPRRKKNETRLTMSLCSEANNLAKEQTPKEKSKIRPRILNYGSSFLNSMGFIEDTNKYQRNPTAHQQHLSFMKF